MTSISARLATLCQAFEATRPRGLQLAAYIALPVLLLAEVALAAHYLL